MAFLNFVLAKYMSSGNGQQAQFDMSQMMEHSSYAVENPRLLVAQDIFDALESIIDPQYTAGSVYGLLMKDGTYRLQAFTGITGKQEFTVLIGSDNAKGKYYYDVRGGITVRQVYSVTRIEESRVRYLVSDVILTDGMGGVMQRCYHDLFKEQFKAERYRSLKMRDYAVPESVAACGYRVFAVDGEKVSRSKWYQDNMAAARMIREYGLDFSQYSTLPSMQDVFAAIRADSYDSIPKEEQQAINREIYDALRQYLPEDDLPFLDEDMEKADPDGAESITDAAIMMAFAGARTPEEFDAIHKALGHNEYRVGSLTDEIYNANPDQGYIVVTKGGDMCWYPECYAIGEWEGAKESPYFGKFQKNENDTLLSFREFHPELFADRLPDEADFELWNKKYLASTAEARGRHPEMEFVKDRTGDEIVKGNWYYSGIYSQNVIQGIHFSRNYGSHTFSPAECRKLLSGEEIVVEGFITKMEMETTIRGMLKDCSDMYSEDREIEFSRTDINVSKKRQMLDAELGISERGLPPAAS